MSLYRAGVIGADAASQAELQAYNQQLQAEIKAAVAAFPKTFTAAQAVQVLTSTAAYGRKQLDRFKGGLSDWLLGFVGRPINTRGLELAVTAAETAAKGWQKRAANGETYAFQQGKNKEWQEVNKQVMTVYIEVGGLIGERVTLDAAKQDLKQDLKDNASDTLTYLMWGGAVVGAIVVVNSFRK